MNQPELGKKIAELRKQKGFTQEELAFKTNLNVRSIQRIESGEVTPRLFTLKILGEQLDYDFNTNQESEVNFWLLLMHISSVIPIIIIPVLIWAWKKEEVPEIREQGIDVINFQLSMTIYLFAASMSIFLVIGLIILPFMGIFIFFVTIINTIKVANKQSYKYPLTIKFLSNSNANII